MLNPYTWLAGLLMALGLLGSGYLYGHHAAANECKADKLKSLQNLIDEQEKINRENDEIIFTNEVKKQERKVIERQIKWRFKNDDEKHPEYSDCRLSADGLRDLQEAINSGNTNGELKSTMSANPPNP